MDHWCAEAKPAASHFTRVPHALSFKAPRALLSGQPGRCSARAGRETVVHFAAGPLQFAAAPGHGFVQSTLPALS
jgi:hypothetical protein